MGQARATDSGGRGALLAAGLLSVIVLAAGAVGLLRDGADPPPPTEAGPGPTEVEAGVPVGYMPTAGGAAAAAIQFDAALFGPLLLSEEDLTRAITTVAATPESAAVLERTLRGLNAALDPDAETRSYWRRAPLGYDIVDHTRERAEVLVWGASAGTEAVEASETPYVGATTTLVRWRLLWADGDWRVGDVELLVEDALADPERLRTLAEVRHGP